jgi:hypothetical protein
MFAPSASQAVGDHTQQSLDGGVYPSVSGDYLFFRKHIGVEGEYSWRWNNSTYLPGFINLPYKPLFYDFNAIWLSPTIRRHFNVELLGGAGVQSTRFYLEGCNGANVTAVATTSWWILAAESSITSGGISSFALRVDLCWCERTLSSAPTTRFVTARRSGTRSDRAWTRELCACTGGLPASTVVSKFRVALWDFERRRARSSSHPCPNPFMITA